MLKSDAGWTDEAIAKAMDGSVSGIAVLRRRYCEEGFEQALHGKKRPEPPTKRKLDGEQEAKIIALRLSPAPEGYSSWSLRLLAKRAVELSIVDSISHETVSRLLKKWMTPKKIKYWVIPPKESG